MACVPVALNTGTCISANGGAEYAYACSFDNITAATVAGGLITALTLTDALVKLVPNKNQTCRFDETGERPNEFSTKFQYNQEGFAYFAGKDNSLKLVADAYSQCCQLVIFWVLNTGAIAVQGVEIDAGTTLGLSSSKEGDCRCTPSLLSDTSANEARLELLFNSKSRLAAPYTDLTPTELEALGA